MKKEMTIVYDVHDGLYINLTNRCPCACTFCLRQTMDTVGESGGLWLEHEPSLEEVKQAIDRAAGYAAPDCRLYQAGMSG